MSKNILILGGSSPLAVSIAKNSQLLGLNPILTYRQLLTERVDTAWRVAKFEVGDSLDSLISLCMPDMIINCIVAKPRYQHNLQNNSNLIKVNACFPRYLHAFTLKRRIPLLLISTDSVFFGLKGGYKEDEFPFARNLYSLTKIMGEIVETETKVVRLSYLGQSVSMNNSDRHLVSRLKSFPPNTKLDIPSNYFWNGLDVTSAGKLLSLISLDIINKLDTPSLLHLHSTGKISRYEMTKLITARISRTDIEVRKKTLRLSMNYTLGTIHKSYVDSLWLRLGFQSMPNTLELLQKVDYEI